MPEPGSVLERIPYGLYAIASLDGGRPHAIVATWVSQVSFRPPLLAAAIERESRMRKSMEESGVFSVNLLNRDAMDLARSVLRSGASGAASPEELFTLSARRIPILRGAIACVECRILQKVATGDHVTFVGEAVGAMGEEVGEPLLLKDTGWRYRRPKGEHSWEP